MSIFRRRPRAPAYQYTAVRAKACRAVFSEARGAIPKVQMTFIMTDESEITFEMEAGDAGRFIEQAMSAYNAIVPPLKTSRGGFGL